MSGVRVSIGDKFSKEIINYPKDDQLKIFNFIKHVEINGFNNLPGRNKSSDNVPLDDPFWLKKVRYAQKYNLWHYHVGVPNYDVSGGLGNYTSKYVLHYIKGDGFIKIVDMTDHPPLILPSQTYLS